MTQPDVKAIPPPKVRSSPEISKSRVKNYAVFRYLNFLSGYQMYFEKKFPKLAKIYNLFMDGIRDFFSDSKRYVKVAKNVYVSGGDLRNQSMKDIEVYFQMPTDMRKVLPVLLISILPFANYVIFPIAYMFPKLLLCRHFWTAEQRVAFPQDELRKRLYNSRTVFRSLQNQLDFIEDNSMFKKCRVIFHKLGSGFEPDINEILDVKCLFESGPYQLNQLYPNHLNGLLRMHGLSTFGFKRDKLNDRAYIIQEMDFAITELGIDNLTQEQMTFACMLRGLNPHGMKLEDRITYLQKWTTISKSIDSVGFSLLLHSPVLLAYNQPSNWLLIH